LKYIPQN